MTPKREYPENRQWPIRSLSSIPDDLWAKVRAKARAEGESVSAVVRRYLEEYVK